MKSYEGGGRLYEPSETTNPSPSGRTSTPSPAFDTKPERVGTKRKLRRGGPTSARWQDSTTEPRPSLVAPTAEFPLMPPPDGYPTPEQMVRSAAQVTAAGKRPGQEPPSLIVTPSPAAIDRSQGQGGSGAWLLPPSAPGDAGPAATSAIGSAAGTPCAQLDSKIAVVNQVAWRMCAQTGHARRRVHVCVACRTDVTSPPLFRRMPIRCPRRGSPCTRAPSTRRPTGT